MPKHQHKESIVFFDGRQQGFHVLRHRIIEIGAVSVSPDGPPSRIPHLVNPGVPISRVRKSSRHHTSMLRGQPTPEEIIPRFRDFIRDSLLGPQSVV